jgi:hypothetical protein
MPDIVELEGSPPRVAIERVVPAVSSPMLHGSLEPEEPAELFAAPDIREPWPDEPAPDVMPVGPEPLVREDREPGFTPRRSDLEIAAFVAVAVSLVGGDLIVGVTCGALMATIAVFRRLPFSFGQGFIGYRSDMGWPQGIQEDDDFHWQWQRGTGRKNRDDRSTKSVGPQGYSSEVEPL